MPGVTLHLVLADRALHRWRSRDVAAPFDPDDLQAVNAFYHGALGPDLGYFPGGHRVLSDLAHCVRTGILARSLLRLAPTVRARAFALGWLTHVLADQAIHPWIGHGVGELVTGSRHRFVDGSSDLLAHVRVEMGLDAWYAERHPEVRRRRLSVAFDEVEIEFLVEAYARTYGIGVPAELFLRSHRNATRRAGQALASMRLVGALMRGRGLPAVPALGWAIRTAWRRPVLRSVCMAYLNPVTPSPWLLKAVSQAMDEHTDAFLDHARDGATRLMDVNLDTGRPLAEERDHPGTRNALWALAVLAAGHPAVPEPPGGSHVPGLPSLPTLLPELERLQEA